MIVVSDTSAISALLKIGRADLLAKLYGEVFVPQAVKNELLVAHPVIPGFFRVVPIANQNLFEIKELVLQQQLPELRELAQWSAAQLF